MHDQDLAGAPWWRREGVSLSGGWHPLSARLRAAELADNEEELYAWEHSEERILLLKRHGINLVVGHFARGFGPTDEAEQQEQARQFAALCHRHGLRHGSYIPNTIYFESVIKDYPDCEEWAVRTHDGRLVHFGGEQTWRWVACFNSPGWRAYVRAEIERAIRSAGTDVIHLDNMILWPEPDSCHCPRCREAFRAFLAVRYPTPEARKTRFGLDLVETARPPNFYLRFCQPWDLDRIRNPLMQEWIDFRCHTLTDYMRDMSSFARGLRPDIAIMVNGQAVWGSNQAFLHGVDSTAQASLADICWDENPDLRPDDEPGAIPPSTLKMRGMNLLRRLDRKVITSYHDEEELAFNLTFSGNPGINAQWGYSEPRKGLLTGVQPGVEALLELFNSHKEFYCGLLPLARTAVWRNQTSLARICFDTHLAACVMEHVLFTRRIPFSIVQDQWITREALAAFDLVILPDVEYITDEQAAVLRGFVQGGGALLVTGRSGAFDGRGRRRSAPLFAAWPDGGNAPDTARRDGPSWTARCGAGRVAYLAEIRYTHQPRAFRSHCQVHYDSIDSRYWKDPVNVGEVMGLAEWLKPDMDRVKVYGHPEARLDWVRFRDGNEGCLLMRAGPAAETADLRLAVRASAAPAAGELWRPGQQRPAALEWTRRGEWFETVLADVGRHALVRYRAGREPACLST